MVEVVPAVYETSWASNAGQMGFKSYITSTGHRAVCDVCDVYTADRCAFEENTGLRKCAERQVRVLLLQNDMEVDIDTLHRDVERGLRELCNMTL